MTNDAPFQNDNMLISLRVDTSQRVSFALQQNGFPVVRDVIIKNDGEFSLSNARLDVSASPQFFKPYSCSLPDIHGGTSYTVDAINLAIEHGQLARLVESEKGTLTIRLAHGEKILTESLYPVEMLARNQWGGLADYPESIAAFVQPNDPAVDSLLGQASQLLHANAPNQAFTGYEGGKVSAWRQLAALWNALYAQGIGYVLPPAGFEDRGQKVRSPSQVIEARLGTCLDTSLLFAACMEQCGLHPPAHIHQRARFCWVLAQ